jgi:hypothetical protein
MESDLLALFVVVVVMVLENVSARHRCQSAVKIGVNQNAHFGNNLLSISLAHPLRVEFLAREYLRDQP